MASLQVRIDDNLKTNSDALFSSPGLDTPTAVRTFLAAAQGYNGFTSEYWYEKKELPGLEKQRIKELAAGTPVGDFELDKEAHKLLRVDGNVFREAFTENRQFLFRGDYTAPSDESDYLVSDNYLSDDGLAGFSITDQGWLVSLFSNYKQQGFAEAVRNYVINKAYKLVCIAADTDKGNGLIRLYKNLYGFRTYAATINDIDVMREHYGDDFIDMFVKKHGRPFHVFMIGQNAIADDESDIHRFKDYFEAKSYVDKTVRKGQAV